MFQLLEQTCLITPLQESHISHQNQKLQSLSNSTRTIKENEKNRKNKTKTKTTKRPQNQKKKTPPQKLWRTWRTKTTHVLRVEMREILINRQKPLCSLTAYSAILTNTSYHHCQDVHMTLTGCSDLTDLYSEQCLLPLIPQISEA